MKISGFTLVRNGVKFEYPFLESLRSLVPIVDELWVNVGISEDDTLKWVTRFANDEGEGKVRILLSEWPLSDPEKRKSGRILSEETNRALTSCTGDWCLYLQADEVLHEEDYPLILESAQKYNDDPEVEAFLFDYNHFYGSFDVVQKTRSAYRREVRMVRRSSGARSVGDAQSFRKPNGEKLSAVRNGARIFHYGWVRSPEAMREKTLFMDTLYHGADAVLPTGNNYKYKRFWGLLPFKGSHPHVMKDRIETRGWKWDLDNSPFVFKWQDLKKVILDLVERATGIRLFEYRSYREIRK